MRIDMQSLLSMEGDANGVKCQEVEYTFYGKLARPEQLAGAIKKEEHEQWKLDVETEIDGKARIRAIDDRRFILTTKIKREGVLGHEECEVDITRDMFGHLREMAEGGMKKTRYVFKAANGREWEVDVFKDQLGQDHPWVKIDLEVKDPNEAIPTLPIELLELISNQPAQQTEEEKAFIKRLWKQEWASLDPEQKIKD